MKAATDFIAKVKARKQRDAVQAAADAADDNDDDGSPKRPRRRTGVAAAVEATVLSLKEQRAVRHTCTPACVVLTAPSALPHVLAHSLVRLRVCVVVCLRSQETQGLERKTLEIELKLKEEELKQVQVKNKKQAPGAKQRDEAKRLFSTLLQVVLQDGPSLCVACLPALMCLRACVR